MSYVALFTAPNKFSPQFAPAVLSDPFKYVSPDTGLPRSTVYTFYGTNLTTETADNYIDRFLLMEKGNQELRAMFLTMEDGDSIRFYTPSGFYLRFYRYTYRAGGVQYYSLNAYAGDGDGEFAIAAPSMDLPYQRWLSFQLDEENEKAVCMLWTLQSDDPASGNANFMDASGLTDAQKGRLYNILSDVIEKPDPYVPGGNSETGGGEGSYDDASDSVTMPGLPALNLSINGFVTAYAPNLTQINALATFIWSDWLSGGPTLPKIFANPEDAIISLHMLPFTPTTAAAVEVTVGNYASGVYMDPMTNQFYTINCGSLEIEEYWGNYLDYNPYTKLTLFLPYVGEITLNPDEVMTRTLTIKYRVDAMTGAFVAFLLRDDDKILGEYQGNCSLQVPISSANYAQLHSALLGLAGSAVSMAAGAAGSGISGLLAGGSGVLTSAAGMMDSKIRHSHSGALGSAAGFMGSQAPYLIIERARQCLPDGLNRFAGYPSQITVRLGDLYGFTSVSEIVLDGIPLTDEELGELREILKGGVYL